MATNPLDGRDVQLPPSDGVWRVRRPETKPVERAARSAAPLDLVEALADLNADQSGGAEGNLADSLLAWLMPRPRNPDTLTQARIVPLLGMAADMVAQGRQIAPDIARLGAAALEQELRMQRALADRRATLTLGDAQ